MKMIQEDQSNRDDTNSKVDNGHNLVLPEIVSLSRSRQTLSGCNVDVNTGTNSQDASRDHTIDIDCQNN
jgi:hypothetical protein